MLVQGNGGGTAKMDSTSAQRIGAGLSFAFPPGERPDVATLRGVLAACQASAEVVRADEQAGTAEIVASGLVFELDGLAPAVALAATDPGDRYGFADDAAPASLEAVRFYPGHHLSGGLGLAPVVRALLALAGELAGSMPVRAIHWHPAGTAIDPGAFSRTTLAWLAGGAFPALGLTALSSLADGSVASRGLAHFVGQELTLRGEADRDASQSVRLAAKVVDRIVQTGPLTTLTQWRIDDALLSAEPAREAKRILVWRAE
jgi:hypothetical protein